MKRNVSIEEISDGRLYGENDMVRADCRGCNGCSQCCKGMGDSIVLDPYDVYRMQTGLKKGFQALLAEETVALRVIDGCVLPVINMTGPEEKCAYLGTDGRCSIHAFRPGICRLFPLGRLYENGDFRYFLQVHECRENNRLKVKASKWIDTPQPALYHAFICDWHSLLMQVEEKVYGREDSPEAKTMNVELLKVFYFAEYDADKEFYGQFAARLQYWNEQY